MGGRENNGRDLVRLRWIGVGVLGLGLLTQACGKTASDGPAPRGDGDAGASSVVQGGAYLDGPVSAGESAGGTESAGGSLPIGGATGQAGEAGPSPEGGVGGVPPVPRRPITAHVVDPVVGAVEGMKLYIAGETFVSDANGIVDATAPFGAYDVLVLDDELRPGEGVLGTGLHVYQGITTPKPVFTLLRDYADMELPTSTVTGTLTGMYPAGLFGHVVFDKHPAQLWGSKDRVADGSYTAAGVWFVDSPKVAGNLMAMLWSRNADNQPTAFWFGKTAFALGPAVLAGMADIELTALPSRELTLQVKVPTGTHAYGTFKTGDVDGSIYNGTSFSWPAGADAALAATTHLVPKEPLPTPALRTSVEVQYGENLADSTLPTGTVATRIPADTNLLAIAEPTLPTLGEPADGAKKIAADAKFTFGTVPNTCHVIHVSIPHPGYTRYDVTIHTARAEFSPPDLGPTGQFWPTSQTGTWSVTSTGPCPSMDALVTPSDVTYDTSTRFWLGAHTFTTAR